MSNDQPSKKSIASSEIKVFSENFEQYALGPFSEGYSAVGEVHYPLKRIKQGKWQEISTHHMFPKHDIHWEIAQTLGGRVLRQTGTNLSHRKTWKFYVKKYLMNVKTAPNLFFPAFGIDEAQWTDYTVKVNVLVLSEDDIAGIFFRMTDSRHHYIFGIKHNKLLLLKRDQNTLLVLKKKAGMVRPSVRYNLTVKVVGNRIECYVGGNFVFDFEDTSFAFGKVGVLTNVPAEFSCFEVFMPKDKAPSDSKKENRNKRFLKEATGYPLMKLYKKIKFRQSTSGRSIRFGDLSGNGSLDILLTQGTPLESGNNYNALTCMTAMDLNGKVLWEAGTPHNEKRCLCSDLPVQIYDIDGDGYNEVICMKDFHLQILNGQTGEVKQKIKNPPSVPPQNKFSQTVGDAISIANLKGGEAPSEILIKDRYSKIWAYDKNLNLLWDYHYEKGEMGHFPFVMDINNDGKDEVFTGYALLDAQGEEIWDLGLTDHVDAVGAFTNSKTNELNVVMAASDEGLIFIDRKGKILKQLRIGHMQTVTIAKLRSDTEGYQIATNTYWGNPGIIYILDESGNIITSFQPSVYGSPICPVNWTGGKPELLLLSASCGLEGGLYDAYGNQAVPFPDDGHPELCCVPLNLKGDERDEIVCWDHDQMWIYTQDKSLKSKNIYTPRRRPHLYNFSNYRANISIL